MKKNLVIFALGFLFFLMLFCIGCDTSGGQARCVLKGSIVESTFPTSGHLQLSGYVENVGTAQARFPRISFTLRDEDGNVLEETYPTRCGYYEGDLLIGYTYLNPGQSHSFVCYTDTKTASVESYTYDITWQDN